MLLAAGRADEAVPQFEKAIRLKPDFAEAHNNLGSAYAMLRRPELAVEQFRQAIAIRPEYGKAHYNLANLHAARGELDAAIEHYERAVALMPDNTGTQYQLGLAQMRAGKYQAAVKQFENISAADSRHLGAQNNLAWILATCPDKSVRNGPAAVEHGRQAEQLSGGRSAEVLDSLAAAYAEAGRYQEAVDTARRALDLLALQPNPPLKDAINLHLKRYEAGAPFHESAAPH
jgi:tetratricopeptide (TPR) repeat protein